MVFYCCDVETMHGGGLLALPEWARADLEEACLESMVVFTLCVSSFFLFNGLFWGIFNGISFSVDTSCP